MDRYVSAYFINIFYTLILCTIFCMCNISCNKKWKNNNYALKSPPKGQNYQLWKTKDNQDPWR